MIWELFATASAGLGAAGIMMMIRMFAKRLPKWLVPAAAGLGMIGFQVYSEYSWFDHTRSLLPPSAVVVAEVPKTAFYKPWSYLKPQVLQFVAVDSDKKETVDERIPVIQTNLYFFERRMSAHTLTVWINCRTKMLAFIPPEADQHALDWGKTGYSDQTAAAVCPNPVL